MDTAYTFLSRLFQSSSGFITLTAIHPDGQHPSPSRHIPIDQPNQLQQALTDLQRANSLGWGAFFAVALRKHYLGRWRRGGKADLLGLPALFVDIDVHPSQALQQVEGFQPYPSALVATGRGLHAYWFLTELLTDFTLADDLLRGLAHKVKGDTLTSIQSMRLVGTYNTKPELDKPLCQFLSFNTDRRFSPNQFTAYRLPKSSRSPPRVRSPAHLPSNTGDLNPLLVQTITDILLRDYGGCFRANGWVAANCLHHHTSDCPGKHFSWLPAKGIAKCWGKHGVLKLRDLCEVLKLDPNDYGGIYRLL